MNIITVTNSAKIRHNLIKIRSKLTHRLGVVCVWARSLEIKDQSRVIVSNVCVDRKNAAINSFYLEFNDELVDSIDKARLYSSGDYTLLVKISVRQMKPQPPVLRSRPAGRTCVQYSVR